MVGSRQTAKIADEKQNQEKFETKRGRGITLETKVKNAKV